MATEAAAVAMETDAVPGVLPMEKCLINKHEVLVPEALSDLGVFMTVFSQDTWSNVLTDGQRNHLQKFLPSFPKEDPAQKQKSVSTLFKGENFKFGNPLKKFHRKLKGGQFSPDIARYIDLCRRSKHREYRDQQSAYYSNILKEILINRQSILDAATSVVPDEPITYEHFQLSELHSEKTTLRNRVRHKCARLMQELAEECGTDDSASSDDDDEEDYTALIRSRKQLLKVLRPGSPDDVGSSVVATFDPIPPPQPVNGTGGATSPPSKPAVPKRCHSPVEMSELSLREMLNRHKRRRQLEPSHPELSVNSLTLEDVISRVQASKKITKVANQKKRVKERLAKKAATKAKAKVVTETAPPEEPEKVPADGAVTVASSEPGEVEDITIKEETDTSVWNQVTVTPTEPEEFPVHNHFFSLLRAIVYEDPEHRVTTSRVEERVREWQESPIATQNVWYGDQPSWVEQVQSALKFLSGDVLGLSLENFVPYLDYKERAQHWKWIGMDRDSDSELEPLYTHWLLHKDELPLDTHTDSSSSPPPPRITTNYTVRPTTEEEKRIFREQEQERFRNPHQAFTYTMHGYECVVGPVKGVYSKESAMNKAREHNLLVSERPAYVTILTLVRDSAARLPNGEGTRSDICELLKDSQFLAPAVTEAQINTVVSGALDRLHYERDPCVKYDVNRKLWIYLHRNRTEQEFERIHQAQGAAVKAKKALQKPKPTKKVKEAVVCQSLSVTPTSSAVTISALTRQSSVLSTGSNDSFVNVETLSPHPPSHPLVHLPPPPPAPVASKTIVVPSSPKTPTPVQSPRSTPQPSPKSVIIGAQSPKVPGPAGAPPASKLLAASLNQMQGLQQQTSHTVMQSPGPRLTSSGAIQTQAISAQGMAPGTPRPVTLSLLQPQGKITQVTAGKLVAGQVPGGKLIPGQVKPMAAGGKLVQTVARPVQSQPVASKVIAGQMMGGKLVGQTASGKLVAQAQAGKFATQVTGARTVLLQTSPGTPAQRITQTLPTQGATVTPQQTSGVSTSQAIQLQLPHGSSSQTVAAALAKAGILAGTKTVLDSGTGQVVNLWTQQPNVVATGTAASPTVSRQDSGTKQTLKIQGGMVHAMAVTSGVTMVTQASTTHAINSVLAQSLPESGVQTALPTTQQVWGEATMVGKVNVTRSTKPTAMVITKQTPSGGRASTATTQTVAQIIQSGTLGKSAVIGGKPIIIGGKSAMVGARPLQIGGKPVQFIGKSGQLGIMQAHPGMVSPISIVNQNNTTVTSTAQAKTIMHATPSMVSQLLQQQKSQIITLPQEGQIKVASQVQGPQVKLAANQQQVAVAVSGSGQTRLVTLPQGLSGITSLQQLTSVKTVSAGQGKSLVFPGGGMVQGGQLVVQQAGTPASTAKVITQQQLLAGGNLRPTLISTGGANKGLQNFQLVKTVISQPGGKPGQTTILLAQPSSQGVTMPTSQIVQTPGLKMSPAANKAKASPIYARIITPPPGVRLAAIRPGQVLAGAQVAPLHGLSMVQGTSQAQEAAAKVPGNVVVTQGATVVKTEPELSGSGGGT